MWIPRDHILVNILSGMPHLVGMILAVWIVSQVLSNIYYLLCNLETYIFKVVTYVLRSAERDHEKDMKKLAIKHDETKVVGKVAKQEARMQV